MSTNNHDNHILICVICQGSNMEMLLMMVTINDDDINVVTMMVRMMI